MQNQPVVKDVMIGLMCYDNRIEVDIYDSMLQAVRDPNCCVGTIQRYNGDSLVTRGRNRIAQMFMDSPYKYLMFIDSDIRFDPNMINKLRSHDKGLVGGIYFKKKIPYEPVMNRQIGQEGELAVMQEIGTGFMMIRRDLFGAFRGMWPENDYKMDQGEQGGTIGHDWFGVGVMNGRYLSEDWWFCQQAAKLGYKTYLDTSIITQHVGKMAYPMADELYVAGITQHLGAMQPHSQVKSDDVRKLIDNAKGFIGRRGETVEAPEPIAPTIPIAKRYVQTNTSDHIPTLADAVV